MKTNIERTQTFPGAVMVSSSFLIEYLATLLAPIFLETTGNDPTLACAAARQTIAEYRARTGAELLLVGQIIALSVASISAAVQSVQDDIPPTVSQRLQTRASTLSRAADRARNALEASMHHPPTSADELTSEDASPTDVRPPDAISPDAISPDAISRGANAILPMPAEVRRAVATVPAVAPAAPPVKSQPVKSQPAGLSPAVWGSSFADIAKEVAANLTSLSPRERQNASIQIAALEEAARSLNTAHPHR